MKTCHSCRKEIKPGRIIGRKDTCPFCGADVRCCMNCSFYDSAASRQCRDPVSELVKDKSRSNFCDFFSFMETGPGISEGSASDRARKALDELFNK